MGDKAAMAGDQADEFDGAVQVVPFDSLEPQWHVPGAKEGGYLRYLTSWVGGPQGFVNPNFGKGALVSEELVTGYMKLMVGCRQKGTHAHTVTEIYIILKGEIEGFDGTDEKHRAGPMDCVYIPKGVPHGVRNCSSEDLELLWIHDGIEVKGASTYYYTKETTPNIGGVQVIKFNNLMPHWAAPSCQVKPHLRYAVSYVGGKDGYINTNPEDAVISDKTALGINVIFPGNRQVSHSIPGRVFYCVLEGNACVTKGRDRQMKKVLNRLDGVWVQPDTMHAIENVGSGYLWVCWALETPQETRSLTYNA